MFVGMEYHRFMKIKRFDLRETDFEGLFVLDGILSLDSRGSFSRKYCKNEFDKLGLETNWVQINFSSNTQTGTMRGLHYQTSPFQESKLVMCVTGKIFDVAVDLRPNSQTFRKYFSIELSSENPISLLIPEGFAHGYQTLQNDSSVLYLTSNFYSVQHEKGIRYDDPNIGIIWPQKVEIISDKDLRWNI